MRQRGRAGGEARFLPVEAPFLTGKKAAVNKPQDRPFRDQRRAAARDLRRAREQSKHQMLRAKLHRALRPGFRAVYLLADAWFGCKENVAACDIQGNPGDLAVAGSTVYVTCWEGVGLRIIARDLTVSGQYVYVADENAGLGVIDLSHPETPQCVDGLLGRAAMRSGHAQWP